MAQTTKQHISVCLLAHVDAGKTTLSERLLTHTGAIRNPGSVDAGTTHTDTLPVERRRGISVKATCVDFTHADPHFHLIVGARNGNPSLVGDQSTSMILAHAHPRRRQL